MTQPPRRIGFIGLGFMGEGMATNVVSKGFGLTVLGHRNRAPIERLLALGAHEAATPAEVARASDVVVTCVTGSAEVEAIVEGPDGILEGAHTGLVVIDCTTADPTSTDRLVRRLAEAGVGFVDAPMGGTPDNAKAGTLQALVGADDETFQRVEPVIATWAATIVRIGPPGSGHRMKLVNNLVSLGYASIYAEALALADASGISAQTFDSVIGNGRMRCGFYETYMRWVLTRDPNAHRFTIANAAKDLGYAVRLADATSVDLAVGRAVEDRFDAFAAAGGAGRFVPMLADFVATGEVPVVDS